MPTPSVTVIIPAFNEASNIRRAITSALQADADQVIVVDGGSTDETVSVAESTGATTVTSEPGRAKQQNHGADLADGTILLFLHADCWLETDCIHQIRNAAAEGKRHGAFRQSIGNPKRIYRWLEWGNKLRVRWFSMAYGDQAIWVDRKLFESVGSFATVSLMEDVKLSDSLRRYSRATLLPGPVNVGSRRWEANGVVRQTIRNWTLLAKYKFGASPEALSAAYRRHDE